MDALFEPGSRPATRPRHGIPWLQLGALTLLADLVIACVIISSAGASRAAAAGSTAIPNSINPVYFLGKTVDGNDCRITPLDVGTGNGIWCHTWSGTLGADKTVTTVTVAADRVGDRYAYRGPLPDGLAWGQTLADVRASLGQEFKVSRMYATPTLVYLFDDQPFGALELTFAVNGGLEKVTATIWH